VLAQEFELAHRGGQNQPQSKASRSALLRLLAGRWISSATSPPGGMSGSSASSACHCASRHGQGRPAQAPLLPARRLRGIYAGPDSKAVWYDNILDLRLGGLANETIYVDTTYFNDADVQFNARAICRAVMLGTPDLERAIAKVEVLDQDGDTITDCSFGGCAPEIDQLIRKNCDETRRRCDHVGGGQDGDHPRQALQPIGEPYCVPSGQLVKEVLGSNEGVLREPVMLVDKRIVGLGPQFVERIRHCREGSHLPRTHHAVADGMLAASRPSRLGCLRTC
jgi:hypothetical protein